MKSSTKSLWILPIAICLSLFSSVAFAQDALPKECSAQQQKTVPQLAQDWQKLRAKQGHFDGKAWLPAVDAWHGSKHCTLLALHQKFLAALPKRSEVMQVMGPADLSTLLPTLDLPLDDSPVPAACMNVIANHPRWSHFAAWQDPQRSRLWAWYSWRGTHDGLLLVFPEGQLADAIWCLSQE